MSDLRERVKDIVFDAWNADVSTYALADVDALIPPGAVLVTEETLAAALISDFGPRIRHEKAAAILARIREEER